MLQTCLPDYRLPFFERLVEALPEARLICGRDYLTPSLALCTEPAAWRSFVDDRFLLKCSVLWQSKVWQKASE
jgi:hypothetical protein